MVKNSFSQEIGRITAQNSTFPNATDAWISYFCIHFKGSFRILSERGKKEKYLTHRFFFSKHAFNYSDKKGSKNAYITVTTS